MLHVAVHLLGTFFPLISRQSILLNENELIVHDNIMKLSGDNLSLKVIFLFSTNRNCLLQGCSRWTVADTDAAMSVICSVSVGLLS